MAYNITAFRGLSFAKISKLRPQMYFRIFGRGKDPKPFPKTEFKLKTIAPIFPGNNLDGWKR